MDDILKLPSFAEKPKGKGNGRAKHTVLTLSCVLSGDGFRAALKSKIDEKEEEFTKLQKKMDREENRRKREEEKAAAKRRRELAKEEKRQKRQEAMKKQKELKESLSERFTNPEENFSGAASTLLDPRFKRVPFSDSAIRVRHEEKIINMMRPLFVADDNTLNTEDE
ncbi:hypothetical protein ElyMa_003403900, partial [Elysia marginata]